MYVYHSKPFGSLFTILALVFTLLVSVYIGLICNHGDDHHDEPQESTSGHH